MANEREKVFLLDMEQIKKKMESNGFADEIAAIGKAGSGRLVKEENDSKPSSPNQKDPTIISSPEDRLASAKAEMGEVREENERLKMILARIVKDYQSLQMHFFDIVQQEHVKKPMELAPIVQEMEEPELISLSLGTTSEQKKGEKISNLSKGKCEEQLTEGLSLGLDFKFEGIESSGNQSPENSFEESKEEITEAWPPSKVMKTARSGEEDVLLQSQTKKARVSVRARCDAPTMNDGCQWRKYGQKISKGNPCPRAYYRCTVAPACPVRKQVQRCAEDMSILITTYEGTHNHPLPISATAMASTTSAAACMLVSGSSASRPSTASSLADIHGLNFSLTDPSRSKPFLFPNPTISSSPSYPTITLDLTSPSSSSSSQFSRFSSNFPHNPIYPSKSFNFSSNPNTSQSSWNNGYLTYGSQNYPKSPIGSSNFLRNSQEQLYQSYLQKPSFPPPQQSLTETVTAATKAITSDPNFQSALAAAITSIVSGGGTTGMQGQGSGVGMENVLQNLKWTETFSTMSPYSSSSNGNANCGSTYLNRGSSSSNSQQGNLMFLSPSLPFSSTKSAPAPPIENREHII